MKKSFLHTMLIAALSLPFSAFAADEAKTTFGFGVEGFSDRYHEPSVDVDTSSKYGSLLGYYNYDAGSYFSATDGRVSYGTTDYKSPSGTMSGVLPP